MVRLLVNIDELFQLDGVIAVTKLDDLGRIVDWKAKGVVDPETKEHMSKLMMEVNALFVSLAREAPRNWSPRRALIYSGGEMTLIAAGDSAVTVETKKVDFGKLLTVFGIPVFSK
jgi:roadblock/LC7 domain-containing protein